MPIEELNKFTIEDLIREIKSKIVERSANGIRGIARIFAAMDNNGNKLLDVDDFRWGLKDFGILISKEEAQQVETPDAQNSAKGDCDNPGDRDFF